MRYLWKRNLLALLLIKKTREISLDSHCDTHLTAVISVSVCIFLPSFLWLFSSSFFSLEQKMNQKSLMSCGKIHYAEKKLTGHYRILSLAPGFHCHCKSLIVFQFTRSCQSSLCATYFLLTNLSSDRDKKWHTTNVVSNLDFSLTVSEDISSVDY